MNHPQLAGARKRPASHSSEGWGSGAGCGGARQGETCSPPQKRFGIAPRITARITDGMGTPIYALRLPQKTQEDIAELARIYGAANARAFAREILEVITSGDIERIKAFNARLIKGMGEQLTLKLNSALDGPKEAEKPAKKPRKPAKKGKGARRAS